MLPVDRTLAGIGADHRRLQTLGQPQDLGPGAEGAAARDDHRPLRPRQQLGGFADGSRVARGRRRLRQRIGERHLGLLHEHVERHLERHRPRPATGQLVEGLAHQVRRIRGALDARRPFGEPLHDAELVGDLVQEADPAPDHRERDLARDAQHRRAGRIGRGQCRGGVEETRAGHDDVGSDAPRRPRVTVGHIGRGLLVPGMHDADRVARVVECREQRVILHARQREDGVDPVAAQHRDERFAAGHFSHEVSR